MKRLRSLPLAAGLRAVREADGLEEHQASIRGLAVPWDTWTRLYGAVEDDEEAGVFERFERGALSQDRMPEGYSARLNLGHDSTLSIASVDAGTLEFVDAERGLEVRATVDTRDSAARDALVRIERGDYSDMSVEFSDAKETRFEAETEAGNRRVEYSIQRATLWGVAVLAAGAYPTTEIALASADLRHRMEREAAAKLRKQDSVVSVDSPSVADSAAFDLRVREGRGRLQLSLAR